MTAAGIDWAWGQPSEQALYDAGVIFVCRYLSSDASKRIGRAEATRHLNAGRGIVLVWEDAANAMLRGEAGGAADANDADQQARAAGLGGCPLFFACDWDAAEGEQPAIDNYLRGAAAVIGRSRTGIYGGFWPVSRARSAGLVAYTWGTRAWSGSNWDSCGWRPNLMQGGATTIDGVSCDWDLATTGDFGQFRGPLPPPPPHEGKAPAFPYPASGYLGEASADPHCHSGYWPADRPHVQAWQDRMAERGWTIAGDGEFGSQSAGVCQQFQGEKGLTVDGKVGPVTWQAAWTAR